jgi:hypothetical protein
VIAAIYTSKNESDIVECSLRHMLAEGVDLILVADSSDPGEGTRGRLIRLARERGCVYWQDAPGPIHRQPELMNELAERARQAGADWVLASDIDEFWATTNGESIAALLTGCPYDTLHVKRYLHHDWNHRRVEPERLGKIAFRPRPGRVLTNGNHAVSDLGLTTLVNVLEIRELHYRGFEHFLRKVSERNATLDPAARARGDASHHTRLEGMAPDELRAEYEAWLAVPTVYDPIPSRSTCRPRSQS